MGHHPRQPVRRGLGATAVVASFVFFIATVTGCFNTYRLTQEEFARLQSTEEIPLTVEASSGDMLLVERDTPIFVRSVGGRRYPVTPFNFSMTQSQLVASDRDTLLALAELESYEVDMFSETQTILLIAGGIAIVAGLIVVTALTAGSKSFDD